MRQKRDNFLNTILKSEWQLESNNFNRYSSPVKSVMLYWPSKERKMVTFCLKEEHNAGMRNEEMNNQKEWKRKKERERMGCNGSEKHTWWCRCPCSLERRTRKSSFQRQPAHKRKWCSKILVEWQRCNTEHTHTHTHTRARACTCSLFLPALALNIFPVFRCLVASCSEPNCRSWALKASCSETYCWHRALEAHWLRSRRYHTIPDL